ncbi:Rid family hydrolase [Rudanella lutea]|uniref:Rid family hydrolase n=1 Tax=Rudanella lutea TaxID=451374 RepID=UPI00036D0010|nr:Rid family hydrolase [Rudanella lutea]
MKHCLNRWLMVGVLSLSGLMGHAQSTPTAKLLPTYLYPVETTVPNRKIYICGQRPVDDQGQVVSRGNLNAQLALIFVNLTQTLRTVGMGPNNIRQISYRITNSDEKSNSDNQQVVRGLANRYFSENKANLPTISDIKNVPQQVDKDVMIEVEVVAVKD